MSPPGLQNCHNGPQHQSQNTVAIREAHQLPGLSTHIFYLPLELQRVAFGDEGRQFWKEDDYSLQLPGLSLLCCAEFTLLAFHGDYCKLLSPQFSSLSPGSAVLCCYFSSSNRSFCLQPLHSGKNLSLSIILSNLSSSASLLFFFLNAHISSTIETPSLAVTPLTQKLFLAASSPTGIDVTSCVTWAMTYNLLALGSSYL